MDHNAMHHGMDMDHGGHGDMDMGEGQCSMNVRFLFSIYPPASDLSSMALIDVAYLIMGKALLMKPR